MGCLEAGTAARIADSGHGDNPHLAVALAAAGQRASQDGAEAMRAASICASTCGGESKSREEFDRKMK